MTDKFGREIDYLRISVTERCDLHCVYCGSEAPASDRLTADEIIKLAAAFAECGFTKARLTGGEPLMREDIADIAAGIAKIKGFQKVTLTTNGVKLAKYASALKKAGINAVNVSLDSLDRATYRRLTGRDCLSDVLEGIRTAQAEGLKVRTNSVLIRGENDSEAEALASLAKDSPIDVRFIELMPFSDEGRNKRLMVSGDELIKRLGLTQRVTGTEKSVARYFAADGYEGNVGFITPVSENFCGECNRIRLLSDGRVRPCLGHEETVDLMPYINDEKKLLEAIKQAVYNKPKGHGFSCGYGNPHAMNKIGG